MADGIHIDAAGHDIGRHQDPRLAVAESFECALAGALGFVAVDRLGCDAALAELFCDTVGMVLGARKDSTRDMADP